MALLLILALVVLAGILLGAFVIKWLFIIAVIAALVWLITFFAGNARANF
jgi:hypothetical protein